MEPSTGAPADAPLDDLALLRAFEPIMRFTRGEYFFPVAVDRYVEHAALWRAMPGEGAVLAVEAGRLDIATLARLGAEVDGPGLSLSGVELGVKRTRVHVPWQDWPPRLRGSSRLAAVGLLGRLVDSLNRLSLVFRGSVPGGSATRSFLLQQKHLAVNRPTYYGRVVRDSGFIVCQYWFFYSFNNWRSGFGGVNEHESDWEQVTVYLDGTGEVDDEGLPAPRWVVFSAHDETGDDLRRRWDDPDLGVVDGRHPVVFSGAGSHSGAYLAGDYLIHIEPPTLLGLVKVVRWIARLIAPWSPSASAGLGIPYVDYARGDGRTIGPGQAEGWNAVRIDDATDWVRDYRGLWGHDTRDRLGGERGPAGPRYERSGMVRSSWAEPVAWAGLAKVAPGPAAERELIAARVAQLDERLAALDELIEDARRELALSGAGLDPASPEVRSLESQELALIAMRSERVALHDDQQRLTRVGQAGPAVTDPHAHLTHRRTPLEPVHGARARLVSWWAILSTPAILWFLSTIVAPGTAGLRLASTAVALFLLLAIEGLVRGRFWALMARVGVLIASLVGLRYLIADWQLVLSVALSATALLVLVVNVREALRR